jgi:hypothetical protein
VVAENVLGKIAEVQEWNFCPQIADFRKATLRPYSQA